MNIAITAQTAPGCYTLQYVANAPGQKPYVSAWPLYLTVTQ